jgi:hypothetical protein
LSQKQIQKTMANQGFGPRPDGQRVNHLQNEPIPFATLPPHQLVQHAATAGNYHPRPQMTASSYPVASGFNMASGTHQVATTNKPQSDFAKAAYASAEQGTSGLQPPLAQSIDINSFKGLKFVTLDGFQIETREIYDKISGTFQWEMCESQVDHCISYIKEKCVDKRVFLVTSGSLGRTVVPAVHDLPQVYAIYIYCADVVSNREWSNKFTKVRVVCNNDDQDLLPQLAVDVAQADMEWGDALVKQGKRDKAKEKYEKALKNLSEHAKHPDPLMINKVKGKLEECK